MLILCQTNGHLANEFEVNESMAVMDALEHIIAFRHVIEGIGESYELQKVYGASAYTVTDAP